MEAAPKPTPPSSGTRKSILLVDDEPAYTDLLEQLLSEHIACPVRSFIHPRRALEALPHLNVGLIVTDFDMPDLNGFEFTREVAKIAPHIPVVMITAHNVELTADDQTAFPMLKVVVRKPFRWTALSEQILRYWPDSLPPKVVHSNPP
jgi:DNA-binding NtrC family response regulator